MRFCYCFSACPTALVRRNSSDSYVLYSYLRALQQMQNMSVSKFSLTCITF
jgi:hypothetical protein